MVLTTIRSISRLTGITLTLALQVSACLAQRPSWSLPPTVNARPMLYGFALECVDCQTGEGGRGRNGSGAPAVVSYRAFPRVLAVTPGSAAEQAGIREGDILQSIEGISILTEPGAQRFARATAGSTVRLGFERASKPLSVQLVLGSFADGTSGPNIIISPYLILKGHVNGDVAIEIWSDDPIVLSDSAGTNLMRIGKSTIVRFSRTSDSTGAAPGSAGRGKKP